MSRTARGIRKAGILASQAVGDHRARPRLWAIPKHLAGDWACELHSNNKTSILAQFLSEVPKMSSNDALLLSKQSARQANLKFPGPNATGGFTIPIRKYLPAVGIVAVFLVAAVTLAWWSGGSAVIQPYSTPADMAPTGGGPAEDENSGISPRNEESPVAVAAVDNSEPVETTVTSSSDADDAAAAPADSDRVRRYQSSRRGTRRFLGNDHRQTGKRRAIHTRSASWRPRFQRPGVGDRLELQARRVQEPLPGGNFAHACSTRPR